MAHLFPIWFTVFAAIFVVANYGASRYLRILDKSEATVRKRQAAEESLKAAQSAFARYGLDYFHRVYPGKSESEIAQLIRDQVNTPAIYEPYVEFRSGATISPTLNIHPAGFRLIGANQGPWPIDRSALNLFVFGGSMAVGSGVADDEAIPAQLQAMLRASTGVANLNVYNFAAGSHFSSQEVTYLQNQIRAGNVPDIALFIDGQNDFYFWNGETAESETIRQVLTSGTPLSRAKDFSLASLPFFRLARELRTRINLERATTAMATSMTVLSESEPKPDNVYQSEYTDGPEITDPARIQEAIARYVANKKIAEGVSSAFGIQPYFVWQPSPLYKYDLRNHPKNIPDDHRRARYGYPVMAAYTQTHEMGSDFDWCADIQENAGKPLYGDIMHYNPAGNRLVAECIAAGLLRAGVIERAAKKLVKPPPG